MPSARRHQITGPGQRRASVSELAQDLQLLVASLRRYHDSVSRLMGVHDVDLDAISHIERAQRHGHDVTHVDLARNLRRSEPAVTAMVDRLAKAGHVTRERSTVDRRQVIVANTEQARAEGEQLFLPLVNETDRVLAGYTDAELRFVIKVIDQLIAAAETADRSLVERPHTPSARA